jgi:zinc transport system substrate-binding protein
MRTIIILILAAALACAACSGGGSEQGLASTRVVASFYPLAFAAEQLGGADVAVHNLTPPGAEPHDLEATPEDVDELRDADLVLLLGDGFQPQLEDAAGTGERVLRLLDTEGLDLAANGDPHVWLDPLRFVLIVKRIATALDRPAAGLERRLRSLDDAYRRGLAHCARREVVTSHKSFGYLADRYGLEQIAITGLSPEAEPAPRDLEQAIDAVRDTGATTVFLEPLVSPRVVDTVAREAGVTTAVLDPIEGLTEEEEDGADYFSLMRDNLAALRKALACR